MDRLILFELAVRDAVVKTNHVQVAGEAYLWGRYLGTQTSTSFSWVHADELGTVRARTSAAGALTGSDLSGPWGEPTNLQNGTSQVHFTGQLFDPETNLTYFGARYYQASSGRFLTPDWSESPEPVPYTDFVDPQTLNLYACSRNNPVSKVDEDGHREDLYFDGGQINFDTDRDHTAFFNMYNGSDGIMLPERAVRLPAMTWCAARRSGPRTTPICCSRSKAISKGTARLAMRRRFASKRAIATSARPES